jgi:hypothetical protein
VNDILAAVRELLEPDPDPEPRDVAVDETSAKPFDWRPSTLYIWPEAIAETGIESGPTARQDFSIAVVLTGSAEGEEADRLRSSDLSDFLDERRDTYLAAIRENQRTALWGHLQAGSATAPATLQLRSIGLRLSGYRIVG